MQFQSRAHTHQKLHMKRAHYLFSRNETTLLQFGCIGVSKRQNSTCDDKKKWTNATHCLLDGTVVKASFLQLTHTTLFRSLVSRVWRSYLLLLLFVIYPADAQKHKSLDPFFVLLWFLCFCLRSTFSRCVVSLSPLFTSSPSSALFIESFLLRCTLTFPASCTITRRFQTSPLTLVLLLYYGLSNHRHNFTEKKKIKKIIDLQQLQISSPAWPGSIKSPITPEYLKREIIRSSGRRHC